MVYVPSIIEKYVDIGVNRVILGTAAVNDRTFLQSAIQKYGDKIAVGVDIKDEKVAIKGWTEKSDLNAFEFLADLQRMGVSTVICTDISKDGAMQGANHDLYKRLQDNLNMNVIASGGVSSIKDVERLAKMNLYGAIIGKAYYINAISLEEAIRISR